MWCMSSSSVMKGQTPMQMHVLIHSPLTANSKSGKISCLPIGATPIHFKWKGGKNLHIKNGDSEAYNVEAGEYSIFAQDSTGATSEVSINVEPVFKNAIVITEYIVTHASSIFSRDGRVEAIGEGITPQTRLLWTNGVETEGGSLNDVGCGSYCAVPVVKTGENTQFLIHMCNPSVVKVKK